ncbi:MAG: TlpA family protein disulfide reductase [Planctomycetota bacterium]|jgi:cytochrome oxidase Cu insertion factor (SCO1/SenC/PrrC family)
MRSTLSWSAAVVLPLALGAGCAYDVGDEKQTAATPQAEEPDASMAEMMAEMEASLLAVGAKAPDVRLTAMDDREFDLSSLRGKTVLLNFWFFH